MARNWVAFTVEYQEARRRRPAIYTANEPVRMGFILGHGNSFREVYVGISCRELNVLNMLRGRVYHLQDRFYDLSQAYRDLYRWLLHEYGRSHIVGWQKLSQLGNEEQLCERSCSSWANDVLCLVMVGRQINHSARGVFGRGYGGGVADARGQAYSMCTGRMDGNKDRLELGIGNLGIWNLENEKWERGCEVGKL